MLDPEKLSYSDLLTLSDEISIGDAEAILGFLREIGYANVSDDFRKIAFAVEVEADEDLWTLAGKVAEVAGELATRGIYYLPDRAKIFDPTGLTV